MTQKTPNKWFEKNISDDIANYVANISVSLMNREKFSKDIRPDVEIEYDDLEKQLEETPSIFAFWSMLLADQKAVVSVIERKLNLRRATLTNKFIDEAKASSTKLAQWQVDILLEGDEELNRLEAQNIIASKTLSKLFAVVESIRMKCDNLRSLSGFKKTELRDS